MATPKTDFIYIAIRNQFYIFAIHTTFIHITFGFLSTAIFGILYGPMAAGIMAAIACFIGMSLFGQGVFFPGFIVSEFLVGYVYGYFLHGRNVTFKQFGSSYQ